MQARINKINHYKTIKEIGTVLSKVKSDLPFQIPNDYFNKFSYKILHKLPKNNHTFIYQTTDNTYHLDDNYFDLFYEKSLKGNLQINGFIFDNSINMPYLVEEDYFKNFKTIPFKKEKKSGLIRNFGSFKKYVGYAASLIIISLTLSVLVKFKNQNETSKNYSFDNIRKDIARVSDQVLMNCLQKENSLYLNGSENNESDINKENIEPGDFITDDILFQYLKNNNTDFDGNKGG